MEQFQRLAATALTEVERQGYLDLVERYRKRLEAPEADEQELQSNEPPIVAAPSEAQPPSASQKHAAPAPNESPPAAATLAAKVSTT